MATVEFKIFSLAEKVGLPGGVLVLRPKASEMFEISITEQINHGDVIVCDFSKITDCSSSFVDEFVLGWQRKLRDVSNTIMILKNLQEDVRFTIESTLAQRNRISKEQFILIERTGDQYALIGDKIEKNVKDCFSLMASGKRLTARFISDSLGVELNSAGNRLKKLYDLQLAQRQEQNTEQGGKFEYFLPALT